MKKQYFLFLFLILSGTLFAQEQAKGYVYDKESKVALEGAEVRVQETAIRDTSSKHGEFILDIPEGSYNIIISKENYYTLSYILDYDFEKKLNIIYLESVKPIAPAIDNEASKEDTWHRDSVFLHYKTAVSLSILELFSMAIAIRYERFLRPKHSIGIHASYYVNGRSSTDPYFIDSYDDSPNGSTYTGFKTAIFYRYYLMRNKTMGLFAEAKAIFGYFDFDYLWYRYSHRNGIAREASYNFWTGGGGISVGVMTRMPKTKQAVLNFSVGYQYFPTPTPDGYIRNNGNGTISILEANTDWWYRNGPGGRFEVKLSIGGIF